MIIKDLVSFFTEPFAFTMVLMGIGVWLLMKGDQDRSVLGKRLFLAGFILLLFVSSKPGAYFLLSPLESAYEPLLEWPTDRSSVIPGLNDSTLNEEIRSAPTRDGDVGHASEPTSTSGQNASEYTPPSLPKLSIDAIVVLGGGFSLESTLPSTSQIGPVSLQRLMEGVRLWNLAVSHSTETSGNHQLPALVVSGGSFIQPDEPGRWTTADVMYGVLREVYLSDAGSTAELKAQVSTATAHSTYATPASTILQHVILSNTPRTTEEEATAVCEMFGPMATVVLVTSASHMRRAAALFTASGLNVIPAPTYYMLSPAIGFQLEYITWSPEHLRASHAAMHEYVGLIWSTLRGKK